MLQLLVGPSGSAKRKAALHLCRIHDDKFAVVSEVLARSPVHIPMPLSLHPPLYLLFLRLVFTVQFQVHIYTLITFMVLSASPPLKLRITGSPTP